MEIEALMDQLRTSNGASDTEWDPRCLSSYERPAVSTEEVNRGIETQFLTPSNKMTWDLLDIFQTSTLDSLKTTPRDHFIQKFISVPLTMSKTKVKFERSGIMGSISGYKEVFDRSMDNSLTLSNSLSLNRKFAGTSSIKGETRNLPFQPGGLISTNIVDGEKHLTRDANGLFNVAPGLSRGLQIDSAPRALDLDLEFDSDLDQEDVQEVLKEPTTINKDVLKNSLQSDDLDDDMIPEIPQFQSDTTVLKKLKQNWAHMVDLNHKIENFQDLVPHMARTWPFELDTFQKEAVFHLEQGDSVFVAAHTSAGKTVVAEYAIAMSNRNMTKCIYTSPIKALSNQKFRDFKDDGQDVGLITGDVQINPEANCLIMTTEILRSMLYRGADLIRDVEFVIFDEVHYVNDIDRGVVWEEVIIMLPDHIKFILLSATVPNTFEFANWIGRTKHKDIYVISTPKRPVPLEIFAWGKKGLAKVIDSQRKFQPVAFKDYESSFEKLKKEDEKQVATRGGRGGLRGSNLRGGRGFSRGGKPGATSGFSRFGQRDSPNKSTWINLTKFLSKSKLLPAVIFVFSKKRCEEYCDTLNTLEFTNHKEKSEIHMFINKSVSMLKKEDRELPQILKVRDMLERGIAVHHGGLLPIVKECIEILFSKGLVKILFATETFAMGLNLPTRTVVFSELRKHDGRGFRNLLPGEFTQMAGRAGRRGLDDTGTVIVMSYNQPISQETLKDVALGTPTKLQSQFRLTYNMILNLLRVEALRVEEMIKRSFSENTTQSLLPEHEKAIKSLQVKLEQLQIEPCDNCSTDEMNSLFNKLIEYKNVNKKIISSVVELPSARFLFKFGRLIIFRDKLNRAIPGFIIRSDWIKKKFVMLTIEFREKGKNGRDCDIPFIPTIDGYVQKFFSKIEFDQNKPLKFVEIGVDEIEFLSSYCLKCEINKVLNDDEQELLLLYQEISTLMRFQNVWREINYSRKNVTLQIHELIKSKHELAKYIAQNKTINCDKFITHFNQLNEKYQIETKIKELKSLVSDDNLELLPLYEQRLQVLQQMNFIDTNLNVLLKGRVACEINSGWELALTELILNNFLSDFTSEEIIALLSVFVYEGKTNDEEVVAFTPRLEKGKSKIKEIMSTLLNIYNENQIPLTQDEEEFLERKRFNLINVVYEWSRGMSFNDIMLISNEAEGTIVRVITRLDEICREVKNAALVIGDNVLHSKMSDAQEKIKRDIVFCASLYL